MWSCDFFGRKVNIQLGAFFALFGGALQSGANSLEYVTSFSFLNWIGVDHIAGCSKLGASSVALELVFS